MHPQEISRLIYPFEGAATPIFSLQDGIHRIPARRRATREGLFLRVWRGRQFIQQNWELPMTVEMVARQSHLSTYHFHRTFRQCFGLPPGRFIRQVKMKKARQLLQEESATVTEVAYRLGFADLSAFSKAFKREVGVAPSNLSKGNP